MAIPFLLLAFVLTFLIVYSRILEASDTSGFFALNSLASSQLIADIAIIVTYFGSELILIPFAGLLYMLSKTNKLETAFVVVFVVVVSDIVLFPLKTGYVRPRPSHVLNGFIPPLGVDNESSFPSGHTARAFAVATLVSVRMGRKYVPLLALAIGVALSRIIIGVHFPSDVVGGAFLGIFIGLVSHEYGPRVYRYAVPRLFPGR
ncbi:phosphatase PAP2 family protein, partial [Candidatus Bathyarchaeota archaeon]